METEQVLSYSKNLLAWICCSVGNSPIPSPHGKKTAFQFSRQNSIGSRKYSKAHSEKVSKQLLFIKLKIS